MMENRTSTKTPDEWITLAQQGKEVWNEQVALLTDSDLPLISTMRIFLVSSTSADFISLW